MVATTNSSARHRRNDSGIGVTPQLSCELCRERKVKCDKLEPCTTCVMSGVECLPIYRQRLPRGRHSQQKNANSERRNQHSQPNRTTSPAPQPKSTLGPRDAFLTTTDEVDTIAVGPSVAGQDHRADLDNRGSIRPTAASRNHLSSSLHQEAVQQTQEIQPDLWAPTTAAATSNSLEDSGAPTQRRDLFCSNPYEEHETNRAGNVPMVDPTDNIGLQNPATKFPGDRAGIFGTLCFGGSTGSTSPNLTNRDVSIALGRLCQVYLDQVDPVFKILHRPSLRKLLQHDSTYLGYPEGHASVIALGAAVCYVATCSLSETQCRDMFQTSKAALVTQYRRACETALDRADVLVTEDITVLQTFVLYLVGRRSEGQEKVVWSLIPLAIRLAKGMSLHADATTAPMKHQSESFFDRQMRKRLWLTICVMDLQASCAHGSEPLILVTEVSSALEGLRHLDDDDFDEQTTDEIPEREDLTCATFAFVTYHAQVSGRLLNYAGQQQQLQREDIECRPLSGGGSVRSHSSSVSSMFAPERGSPPSSFSSLDRGFRERTSAAFDRKAFELIRFCDPEASRQAWFAWHSTQTLVASMRLAAMRPLPSTFTGPERDNDMELQLAFRILEKVCLMHTDLRCEGMRWYIPIPWHALAVAIGGCYICTDEKMLRERWPLVKQVWQLQKTQAGCGGSSSCPAALASPLQRLVRKTRERVGRMVHVGGGGGGGNKNAMLENGGNPLQQNPLLTPPLTISSVASTSYFITPATSSGRAGVSRAPSRMGGDAAAAPSFSSSNHHQHPQQRPSYNRAGSGSGSLSGGGHQSAVDTAVLQDLDFTLDSFPIQGAEDDSSDQSQQDSLFDSIDLQDEDMITMFAL
ncbi:hypothetical protein B7463_g7777, partial [Scytalidium lignicola]